jgi:hypothetical protein
MEDKLMKYTVFYGKKKLDCTAYFKMRQVSMLPELRKFDLTYFSTGRSKLKKKIVETYFVYCRE